MGSDYLFVLGMILIFNLKTSLIGVLCIICACCLRKRKTIKEKKHICMKDITNT